MRIYFWLLTAMLLMLSCQHSIITVDGGKVQGVPSAKAGIVVFKGIPYAAPPVGDLRWEDPQPVQPWEGVRVCDSFGPIAPQPGNAPGTFYGDEFYWEGTPEQSEDCLYLNVWAPAKSVGKPAAKLPVAMWIHGGAFLNGYGYEVTMDGDEWAARGVILVTINYRLGGLGFVSHPELTEEQGRSGNYGLMDQIAALRWVRDNIAQFGGDPSNITVFGQSAGAMSVKNLLISPLSKDLLAKAIIQSGGGLAPGGITSATVVPQSECDWQGRDIMETAGFGSLSEMRAAPASEIAGATSKYLAAGKGWVLLRPHIDGYSLTETFDDAVYDGSMAPVPVMIGYNKDDMGTLAGTSVDRFCAVRDSLGFPVYEYEFLRELPTDEAHPASAAGAFHSAELWYMFGT
ncbi:MAG: carboxylesterase family protein, partial [Bacteroidales bacterium]|nr:carboxylesterase family protein [Bacteroidales bacterium]